MQSYYAEVAERCRRVYTVGIAGQRSYHAVLSSGSTAHITPSCLRNVNRLSQLMQQVANSSRVQMQVGARTLSALAFCYPRAHFLESSPIQTYSRPVSPTPQAIALCNHHISSRPSVADAPAWQFLLEHDLPFERFVRGSTAFYAGEFLPMMICDWSHPRFPLFFEIEP